GELQMMDQVTHEFSQFLVHNNLLTPMNMRVNVANQVRNITGCYVVNEDRLNNFTDKKFLELRQKGYLSPIYAHLMSLVQIEHLASLKKPTVEAGAGSASGNVANTISVPSSGTIQ
ncbi:MAG: SapC family protein, partial [Magnetococcales bacterium]|nr:SapC family protein [Magnetococcales bacterium]